jgi:osmoprotectant transport system permease protein
MTAGCRASRQGRPTPPSSRHERAAPSGWWEKERVCCRDLAASGQDLRKFDLVLLEDDRQYFPKYLAAPLMRRGVDGRVKLLLDRLAGTLTDSEMRAYNALVSQSKLPFAEVASEFLREKGLLLGAAGAPSGKWAALRMRVGRHLQLTLLALVAGLAVAIPLGILVYRFGRVARPLVYAAGTLQTIPSIALLAFMIPLFGIGVRPTIAALLLSSLLPILRNTAAALSSIDPVLKKVSVGMGLTGWQRLRYVELPLAAPSILAGIKTAAVINIGTATLAAYIGAGGLGDPIVTGLALYDPALILEGAIPAALLAILTELTFDLVERLMVPRHLLQKPAE